MILDNSTSEKKVSEWIKKYTEEGYLDVVTGYFTIGALAFLSNQTNQKISKYQFVIGELTNFDEKIKSLDLLNESIDIATSLKLTTLAKEAVDFLKLDKVSVKILEPNFCHAKLYVNTVPSDTRNHNFISGSSNLTEAGIGLKEANSNLELNIAETGDNSQFKELSAWFEDLWKRPQAKFSKTIISEDGKESSVNFKQYLIDEISKLFQIYTPEQIYFKILYELFYKETDSIETENQLIRLEDTSVYKKLYDFQKGGVKSLIKMLNKYNGAILADAVGLGKTWSALAVMKSFQMKGFEVIMLCPKKLELNWKQYLKRQNSIFEDDKLDYVVRFHSDLRENGLSSTDIADDYFVNDKPKLIVIDESHNLRNQRSVRYQFLLDEILRKSTGETKVLLLSATPINNSFKDIRNQFKIMTKGDVAGFKDLLNVNNLDSTFSEIQNVFKRWVASEYRSLADFFDQIKNSNFFNLTDHLVVARTRKKVKENFKNSLEFPKHKKPKNYFITPNWFGDVKDLGEYMEKAELNLSAYLPSTYLLPKDERFGFSKTKSRDTTKDESQREHFLVKMMKILMLKRLESSWYSFKITVQKIQTHHEHALQKIHDFKQNILEKEEVLIYYPPIEPEFGEEEDESIQNNDLTLGKKNPVSIADIFKVGNLDEFEAEIQKDFEILNEILENVTRFENRFLKEKDSSKSIDIKLEKLIEIVEQKKKDVNKKLIIFTAYSDTAEYLYDQLGKRASTKIALVSGSSLRTWNSSEPIKMHETILQKFAPFTKLFMEKNWPDFTPKTEDNLLNFEDWKKYIKDTKPNISALLNSQVDVLIATDILSEGQNLQDADMVINYDIHWNPVRVIQRFGRIDRIGSPNKEIQCVNFWPSDNIDNYINLKSRVEGRMAAMKVAGAEVMIDFTEDFSEMMDAQSLEDRQNATILRQINESFEDDLDGEKSLGFDDFSFDNYRQQLNEKLSENYKEFKEMPNGVFSGLKIENSSKEGLVALLGYPAQKKFNKNFKYLSHELIFIDKDGNQISNNQKVILEFLVKNYKLDRFVPIGIDQGDETEISKLGNSLKTWIENQAKETIIFDDGSTQEVVGKAGLDLLEKLKNDPKNALKLMNKEGTLDEKYNFENFDLITWLIVSKL
ncbi:MAG: hypothetical protein RLZZ44_1314 [Bacteroidota bacterium]